MIMPSKCTFCGKTYRDAEEHNDEYVDLYHPDVGIYKVAKSFLETTASGTFEKREDGVYYNKDVEEKTNKKPHKETQRWWKWLEEAHTKGLI